ncbi:MAG: UDP-N-acetylglucosamine--N-acetylmuramyl-(pentapeptide) pyrophosphoryl-undecaprenol N-acetylglucosamine transferase, partial [Methanosphaera stadtmanae]|nr:UDP-N-acetylglucosamine--N-acetylmuramyl-(pentapeptide) pyrophosphoryl-undecaprenol N-acetylglucosamine transferase [Methanosphaera stadtmanae]
YKMKILFTTCGVGIGHASRDVALAELLQEKGHIINFASYGSGLEYLKMKGYKPYELPQMNFSGKNGEINVEKSLKDSKDIPLTFIKSMYKESRIINEIKPDLIITDSDYSATLTARFLNIPCYIITNDLTFGFSDSADAVSIKYLEKGIRRFIVNISKGCQKILVPDIPGSITIPEELEKKTFCIGPLLHQNPNEIDTKENLRKKYNQNINDKILTVTIGGSEFGKVLISNICDIYDKLDVDKIIVFVGLEINPNIFKIQDNEKIIIKQFTHNLIEWMKLSDLTLALAGHTTSMELISIKKPNILIPLTNHVEQERNIENILKYDLTKTINIDDKENLIQLINSTINNLEEIHVNDKEYSHFIQYNGRENALKLIENVSIKNNNPSYTLDDKKEVIL